MSSCVSAIPEPEIASATRNAAPPARASTAHGALSIGLIGPGRVGAALLAQLRQAQPRLARDWDLHLALRGVAARRRMWLDCDDEALDARRTGAQTWRPNDLDALAAHVAQGGRAALLVDCSASEAVAAHYPAWLAAGIHVVTPNKHAGSGALTHWQAIGTASRAGAACFRHEATVGAGLPVVQTLRDLLDTGDQLHAIEGVFSGSLAWLFHHHDGARPFSAWLREAQALGYTEPDPREDLSGRDVARKLVILAREAGWPLSLEDVRIDDLVPPALAALPCAQALEQLDALDAPLADRLAQARAQGGVLRHVARLDRADHAEVRLRVLPPEHPFAHGRATDNMVCFHSRRYEDNPLLVQGPGAGPEVTAAGVFADLLRVAESLGARR